MAVSPVKGDAAISGKDSSVLEGRPALHLLACSYSIIGKP